MSYNFPTFPQPFFVIITNGATDAQRNRIHELVKENSPGWWHYFTDAWIVVGHNAEYWRDLAGDLFAVGSAGVLVLQIQGNWASRAPAEQMEWLIRTLR